MENLSEYIVNHPWLSSLTVLAAVLVAVFEIRSRRDSVGAISAQDLIRLQNQGALLIDLRQPAVFEQGHISGARRMDSSDMLTAGEHLKKYKEKSLVVYCESGSTGAAAVRVLAGQGFTRAFNLRGGLATWRSENLPLVQGEDKAKGQDGKRQKGARA
ncbi:MAG: rhodanese-like domain-containing protein [Steroidobacteraceae bacterium]|jgi:rhodanese-related sulfurtransferase|nr:rhodanese-like domain-containing protein [Gammaproteobacteria bacterium]